MQIHDNKILKKLNEIPLQSEIIEQLNSSKNQFTNSNVQEPNFLINSAKSVEVRPEINAIHQNQVKIPTQQHLETNEVQQKQVEINKTEVIPIKNSEFNENNTEIITKEEIVYNKTNNIDESNIEIFDEFELKDLKFTSISDTLEHFNRAGDEYFISFKRGSAKYKSLKDYCDKFQIRCDDVDNTIKRGETLLINFRVDCSFADRNKKQKETNKKNNISMNKTVRKRNSIVTGCLCSYSFVLTIDEEKIISFKYKSHYEIHNHNPKLISKDHISTEMINEMKIFTKRTPVFHIQSFLENKYNKNLSYSMVFYEFKKIYPTFGADDVKQFIKSLQYKKYYYQYEINNDGSLNKIIF